MNFMSDIHVLVTLYRIGLYTLPSDNKQDKAYFLMNTVVISSDQVLKNAKHNF